MRNRWPDLIKPALYVAPNQTIDTPAAGTASAADDRMAIVVNEFGSAIGMITMEDIVEEVLGEIDVGYDFDEYQPKRRDRFEWIGDDICLMDARMSISEANEVLGLHLPARDYHTLGGLVMARLRRIPGIGDYIVESSYRLTVAEATERAVNVLRVEPDADVDAASSKGPGSKEPGSTQTNVDGGAGKKQVGGRENFEQKMQVSNDEAGQSGAGHEEETEAAKSGAGRQ